MTEGKLCEVTMFTRIAISVLAGLILFAACTYTWIWHDVHRFGFPSVNEQAYQQAIAVHRDGS